MKFPERCKNCKYYTRIMGSNTQMCEYINYTGEPRGEPVSNKCTKFKSKTRKDGWNDTERKAD